MRRTQASKWFHSTQIMIQGIQIENIDLVMDGSHTFDKGNPFFPVARKEDTPNTNFPKPPPQERQTNKLLSGFINEINQKW